jgi:hypothetical protein
MVKWSKEFIPSRTRFWKGVGGLRMSEFIAKDGRAVVVRELRLEDLDGLLELVNSTVREGAPINRMTELS